MQKKSPETFVSWKEASPSKRRGRTTQASTLKSGVQIHKSEMPLKSNSSPFHTTGKVLSEDVVIAAKPIRRTIQTESGQVRDYPLQGNEGKKKGKPSLGKKRSEYNSL